MRILDNESAHDRHPESDGVDHAGWPYYRLAITVWRQDSRLVGVVDSLNVIFILAAYASFILYIESASFATLADGFSPYATCLSFYACGAALAYTAVWHFYLTTPKESSDGGLGALFHVAPLTNHARP